MPSPYNNQLPVDTRNDFYGFDEQLKTMESFIDTSINGRSTNFIFLGEKTTGKSSFLNITREYAQEKGYLVNEKPFLVNTSHGENYLKFYSSIYSHILKPLSQLTGNDLHKDFTTLIDTGQMPKQRDENDQIIRDEEGNEKLDLMALPFRLPTIYNTYVTNHQEANIDANVIIEDLEKIHEQYVEWLIKQDSNGSADKIENNKIAIFFDDFQNILGRNTDQIFKSLSLGEDPVEYNRGSDIIAEHLKNIVENLSSKFLFVVASYPRIMDQTFFPDQGYVLNRNFKQIPIDHFETVKETKKLILGPLKNQLEKNHPLRKDFAERTGKDGTRNNNNILNRLARIVHDDTNGYIWDIKEEMDLVFDYYEKSGSPPDEEKTLLGAFEPEPALEIYRKLKKDIEQSEYHKKVEKYDFDKKYHLQLLTTYDSFTLDEIVEYHTIEIALSNLVKYDKYGRDLKDIDENVFSNRRLFFGSNISSLLPKQVKQENLKESLDQFVKDGIINYNEHNQKKYALFGELKDHRYTRNFLRVLSIKMPIAFSKYYDDEKFNLFNKYMLRLSFYISPIGDKRISNPSMDISRYLNTAKDLFQYFESGNEVLTDPSDEERDIIESISRMNFININDGKLSDYTIEIYSCHDYAGNQRIYIGRQSHKIIEISEIISNWADKNDIVYNKIKLLDELEIPTSYKNIYKQKLDDKYGMPFYNLTRESFEGEIAMLDLWQKGELDRAFSITTKDLENYLDLKDSDEDDYYTKIAVAFNNMIYLSLCDPNKQNYKTVYRDYKNRIDNLDFIPRESRYPLLQYNIFLLKFFNDDKFDPNVFKDFDYLEDKGPEVITCLILILNADGELVVEETKYDFLTCVIYTITNLIINKKIDNDDIQSRPIINKIIHFYNRINDVEDSINKQNFLKVFKNLISESSTDKISADIEEAVPEIHAPSSYLQLYEERKITEAYELASRNLEDILKNPDLKNNDISNLMNNTMFLSLCQNNSNHYSSFYKKHGSKISNMLNEDLHVEIFPLLKYNYLVLSLFNESEFDTKLFFNEYQLREKYEYKLATGIIIIETVEENGAYFSDEFPGNFGINRYIIEIPHITLDLAWILTLFSLSKGPIYSKDEKGYINIELEDVINKYKNLDVDGGSCLETLADKYPHFSDIFLK